MVSTGDNIVTMLLWEGNFVFHVEQQLDRFCEAVSSHHSRFVARWLFLTREENRHACLLGT